MACEYVHYTIVQIHICTVYIINNVPERGHVSVVLDVCVCVAAYLFRKFALCGVRCDAGASAAGAAAITGLTARLSALCHSADHSMASVIICVHICTEMV